MPSVLGVPREVSSLLDPTDLFLYDSGNTNNIIMTMTNEKSIFGLPFEPDDSHRPTREQLDAFLQSPCSAGGKDLYGSDLLLYRQLLDQTAVSEQKSQPASTGEDIRDQIFSGVLRSSRFANQSLLMAVELYKYHLHMMTLLDFDTPTSFIQAADQTIAKLNKKNIDHVVRILRLQEMVLERKKIIRKLEHSFSELAAELLRIAAYIKSNLSRMQKHCEASITMLSDTGITGKKERQMIEDIKDRPKKALQSGKITMQDLGKAVKEVGLIAAEMSTAVRRDINATTNLYATLHEHLKNTRQALDVLQAAFREKKDKSIEDQKQLLAGAEYALISLLSSLRPDHQIPGMRTATAYEKFIARKRSEMLEFLFGVVQKDRRLLSDRRTSKPRRKNAAPANYKGPKRRSGLDRRTGKNRRSL